MTTHRTTRSPITLDGEITPLVPPPEFLSQCAEYGIVFDSNEVKQLGLYLALLLEINRQFNLTAITDHTAVWMRHIFDSLSLLMPLAELTANSAVADIGSGGGLPGIPLAICRRDLNLTLVESTGKKAEFLRAIRDLLHLPNVSVVQDRAESLAHDKNIHREKYDAVVARAVGSMNVISELTVPFAKPPTRYSQGGVILLIKGEKSEIELVEAKQALYFLHARHAGTIITPSGRIVILTKAGATPRIYPRRPGEPKRRPLGRVDRSSPAG